VTEADLAPFNSLLGEVRVRADAFREGSEFVRRVVPLIERPQDVPSALAWLATDVLAHAARIRRCANEESCTLFFLDETKNHTRVWCSMKDCGNRAKAAAFRARARNATVTESKR
jgi:predicted RNA-binding Zn ribbon-like protein